MDPHSNMDDLTSVVNAIKDALESMWGDHVLGKDDDKSPDHGMTTVEMDIVPSHDKSDIGGMMPMDMDTGNAHDDKTDPDMDGDVDDDSPMSDDDEDEQGPDLDTLRKILRM